MTVTGPQVDVSYGWWNRFLTDGVSRLLPRVFLDSYGWCHLGRIIITLAAGQLRETYIAAIPHCLYLT
jgi:hypothetical protein